ncbi:WD40 repeat-like protein [Marasmius fiardii PR-910]|nr:WD40 repeat-like protein [Marasmius fiardii PR-910]
MKLTDSEQDYSLSNSSDPGSAIAGPSKPFGMSETTTSNGHYSNGKSYLSKGSGSTSALGGAGTSTNVTRVDLPGDSLYPDSNVHVSRQEFVRLLLQGLRDVGYMESAATLEAESGYVMEEPQVRDFRDYVLQGNWGKAEATLMRMGMVDEQELTNVKLLISKQKYLELLEAKKTHSALQVLRNELTPYSVDTDLLHNLTSLIMCSDPEDVRRRAEWDGASGTSRLQLLNDLQRYIPSSVMIPQRRFLTLLEQAHSYQLQRCIYHNLPANLTPFSLYTDHQCDKVGFPRTTTNILTGHGDEVWNIEWSHDGTFLASASRDKTAIIWRVKENGEWEDYKTLRQHPYPVGCLAWSLDDLVLLTSSENYIKIWVTKTGVCLRTLDEHTETVTVLSWLPDGSGFLSAALDRKIIQWDHTGSSSSNWGATPIRITDLAITPDLTRVVTIGMNQIGQYNDPSFTSRRASNGTPPNATGGAPAPTGIKTENRMVIYEYPTREVESSIRLDGELTSVKVSQHSNYALINHAPDEIHLWDLHEQRLARKFTGQKQGRHVIRSCFGGTDGNFVVSGSEDGNVYVWHRDTGTLLEVLSGHGEGSVNSVAWNPKNPGMFASCSDDRTVRIWEAPQSGIIVGSSYAHPAEPTYFGKGKGKTRQVWNGESDGGGGTVDSERM